MPVSLSYRLFCATLTVLFLLCTAVQFNDPDAWRWIVLYGAAATAAGLAFARRLPRWLAPAIIAVAVGWLLLIAGPAWHALQQTGSSLSAMSMRDINVELVREAGGLALVAIGMLVLTTWRRAAANRR